ncbi:hypothetical protein K491DRAFT_716000 [Lophiostoma macrostomum CBS 122681]|uniref:Uncharacterized protein n=1 Tax=Lophiostoma macrostomum CBS 122681 TaxID=1314788 RepID=A0A6A6T6P4_9PLEO|nr:hypothetical protein K491DRAFT_716000 [Lophiostoma macrostomum CBS 122681]
MNGSPANLARGGVFRAAGAGPPLWAASDATCVAHAWGAQRRETLGHAPNGRWRASGWARRDRPAAHGFSIGNGRATWRPDAAAAQGESRRASARELRGRPRQHSTSLALSASAADDGATTADGGAVCAHARQLGVATNEMCIRRWLRNG